MRASLPKSLLEPLPPGPRVLNKCSCDSLPNVAVEHAVVDGFAEVVVLDIARGFEVGDGARKAKYLVMGTGGQAKFVDADFHQIHALVIEWTELADLAARHLGVV